MPTAKEVIEKIVLEGTNEQRIELYGFDATIAYLVIVKKFRVFSRACYSRYFMANEADFHPDMILDMVESYYGKNKLVAAFRGSAKTSLKKLFDVFVLLNDKGKFRRYTKVLSRDSKNSQQIVTDVYNLMVEVAWLYGDVFEHEGDIKREETMKGFTMKNGRKYTAGTVGQAQRGHIQDAYRPDWIWFEDVEDRESIRSMAVTRVTIDRCGEAIDGLAINGSFFVTCNYISDTGVIQWFMNKPSVQSRIIPLLKDDADNASVTWKWFTPEKVKEIRDDAAKDGDFFGEYQCDPQKSTNKFFDLERIKQDIKKCTEPKKESAGVKYWSAYQPNHRYGQGSDHSEGVGGDANTDVVFDFTTGDQVASYANNLIAPDLSAHEFARIGREYGNCIWAFEVNNSCGGTVRAVAKELEYPNLYKRVDDKGVTDKPTEKIGWETNGRTKYAMFFEFRTDYNEGLIKIHDVDILREMKAYTNSDLNETTVGLVTKHFDLLMAAVIAWQMKKYAEVVVTTTKSYREGYKKYIGESK